MKEAHVRLYSAIAGTLNDGIVDIRCFSHIGFQFSHIGFQFSHIGFQFSHIGFL
jgi:hypothetical protein